jgi:transcriptional regulator with XRE-family HTH domain
VNSGSKADRSALRKQVLDSGGAVQDVAAEMHRRWGLRPRPAYRHAYGWTQGEVAARFIEVAARYAPDSRLAPMAGARIGEYERWPRGGRRPSPYVLAVLAEVYGTGIDALLDEADNGAMPEQDRVVVAALGRSSALAVDRPARRP